MRRKILIIGVWLLAGVGFLKLAATPVLAYCYDFATDPPADSLIEGTFDQISFSFKVTDKADTYLIQSEQFIPDRYDSGWVTPDPVTGEITPKPINKYHLKKEGAHTLHVGRKGIPGDYCLLSYTVKPALDPFRNCILTPSSTGSPGYTSADTISIHGSGIPDWPNAYRIIVRPIDLTRSVNAGSFNVSLGKLNDGSYIVVLQREEADASGMLNWVDTSCTTSLTISPSGGGPGPGPTREYDPCWPGKPDAPKPPDYDKCVICVEPGGTYKDGGSWTALGCIPNDPRDFVAWLLARAIGIGGGIAFLLMIWGGFQVITSAGDPDRLNAGKEIITSAIAGLLLIIFSLFLLELIGVDILGLKEVGFEFGGG